MGLPEQELRREKHAFSGRVDPLFVRSCSGKPKKGRFVSRFAKKVSFSPSFPEFGVSSLDKKESSQKSVIFMKLVVACQLPFFCRKNTPNR